jgi:hypothetical protein
MYFLLERMAEAGLNEEARALVVSILGRPILTRLIPRESREEIQKGHFKRILRVELTVCDNPSVVGISGHLEDVGLKS